MKYQKLNQYALCSDEVISNILGAMAKAVNNSIAHVDNKKGEAFLAVRYKPSKNGGNVFEITDLKGNNMARELHKAARLNSHKNKRIEGTYRNNLHSYFVNKIAYPFELQYPISK